MKKILIALMLLNGVAFAEQQIVCVDTVVSTKGLSNLEFCVEPNSNLNPDEVVHVRTRLFNTIGKVSANNFSVATDKTQNKILISINSLWNNVAFSIHSIKTK